MEAGGGGGGDLGEEAGAMGIHSDDTTKVAHIEVPDGFCRAKLFEERHSRDTRHGRGT